MRSYKLKDVEHKVYEDESELPEGFTFKEDWRDSTVGDWVLADDGCYIQVLREGRLKKPGRKSVITYVGTCTGTFICRDSIKMDTEKRVNIYNFSGKHPEDHVKERKYLTPREGLFAQFVAQGMEYTDAYLSAFKTNSPVHAKASAGLLLKQERIKTAMKAELKPVLKNLGIDDNFVLSGIKEVAANGDKDSDKLKALFELADILEMKETRKEITAIGGAVFKGFLPEDAEVVQERKNMLGEGDA